MRADELLSTREATEDDREAWAALRHALWPDCSLETVGEETEEILASPDQVCFLLIDRADGAVGFAEGEVHLGEDGPYAHVEGWYVDPAYRGRGHGRDLIGRLEQWCLHRAIRVLTSDTTPEYPASPKAHARAGFRVLKEMTIFLKELKPGDSDP